MRLTIDSSVQVFRPIGAGFEQARSEVQYHTVANVRCVSCSNISTCSVCNLMLGVGTQLQFPCKLALSHCPARKLCVVDVQGLERGRRYISCFIMAQVRIRRVVA